MEYRHLCRSYLMSGGEVEFYDSCSGKRTFDGCKTVSLTISAGPNVMVGGVGFAVQGNLLINLRGQAPKTLVENTIFHSIISSYPKMVESKPLDKTLLCKFYCGRLTK